MNIVYACDDSYSKIAGISIISLFRNNINAEDIDVYVLCNNVSDKNRLKLTSLAKQYGRNIYMIEISDKLVKLSKTYNLNMYCTSPGAEYTIYARFFVDFFLPMDISRVIYLDCDTLICGSIDELYNIEFGSKVFAMGYDCMPCEYKEHIGLCRNSNYFNSGVIVINLNVWRAKSCYRIVTNKISHTDFAKYALPDQDLINVCFQDDILAFNVKFNFLSQFCIYKYKNIVKAYRIFEQAFYNEKQFCKIDSAIIFHFNGNSLIRPWYTNSRHPRKRQYDEIYWESPWKDEIQNKFSTDFHSLIQNVIFNVYPQDVSAHIEAFAQWIYMNKYYRT